MEAVPPASPSRWATITGKILPRLAFYPFLAASLLVFPAALPWMILGWLALAGVQWLRGKPAWKIIAFCLGVILIKRVDWPPGLIVLGLGMIAIAIWDWIYRNPWKKPRVLYQAAAFAFLLVAWIAMTLNWQAAIHKGQHLVAQQDRPIVCLGDSLAVAGFPRILQRRLRVPLLDFSRGGISAVDALEFYPEVLASKPQTIIIELGGHDYLKGRSRKETKANLERMIRTAREVGAEVILFEVPRGFITDPFSGLERELARELDLEIIPDGAIRNLILFSPFTPLGKWTGRELSYDGLHPNDEGHVFLAGRIEAALRRVYGDTIFK